VLLARVIGVGVETADMLVQEVLSRAMRDRRAVGRYAGLTGTSCAVSFAACRPHLST
jgi:transposase